MIDAISLQDSNTLVLKQKTEGDAADTCALLLEKKRQEQRLGNKGLSTNYEITTKGTKVIISGSVNFAVMVANKYELMSDDRASTLLDEIKKTTDREKTAQSISAKKGLFAHHSLQRPIPQLKPQAVVDINLTPELQELLAKQRAEPPLTFVK